MLEPIPFAGYMEIEEMNNEPVAWINQNIDIENGKPQLAWNKDNFAEICKPLYTHPAKTLTDEEIIDVVESVFGTFYSMMACNNSWVDFARAILKKASEK